MAMRRHRVKPTANLMSSKRKVKMQEENSNEELDKGQPSASNKEFEACAEKDNKESISIEGSLDEAPCTNASLQTTTNSDENSFDGIKKPDESSNPIPVPPDLPSDIYIESNEEVNDITYIGEFDEPNAFKMPASQMGTNQLDDNDDNVIQMDLQKSTNGYPMSPSKQAQARQRIRPTPVFGQRRNSFVGSSSSPSSHNFDDGDGLNSAAGAISEFAIPCATRRERYLSGSSNAPINQQQQPTQHKYLPTGIGPSMSRIRTESSCSTFSESVVSTPKTRKTDESKHHRQVARRDFETRFNHGIPDKSTFKMFDLIYYNPDTNPMQQKSNTSNVKSEEMIVDDTKKPKVETVEKLEASTGPTAMPVPQLKLNANGELILDDKSLEIETTAEQEARKMLANSSLIFVDENTGMNGFYKRHKRTREWPAEETVRFYRCLQIVGTDFSLMCQLFPKRTRRDLKLKFKKEERVNGTLIDKAILYPKTFNIDDLKEQLEKEDREKAEAEQRWKEIKEKEAKNLPKVHTSNSKAARSLKNGDYVYTNENITKRKLGQRSISKGRSNKKGAPQSTTQNSIDTPDVIHIDDNTPIKQKRSRKSRKIVEAPPKEHLQIEDVQYKLPSFDTIKHETAAAVKTEHSLLYHHHNNEEEIRQQVLEQELTELLQPTAEELHFDQILTENNAKSPSIHNKTLINLDDGSLSYVNSEEVTRISEVAVDSTNDDDMSEHDIQKILTELAEGSLVMVSTLDPDDADKVNNEIYILNKQTGELCDEPLDIPESIVQCILNVMS